VTVIISPVEINMSKFNAGKASVLALTAVAVLASFLLGKSLTSVRAGDDEHEQENNDNNWSVCVSTGPQCGTDNGHKSKTITQDANHTHVCPTGYSSDGYDHDEWDKECRKEVTNMECPNGNYTSHDSSKACSRNGHYADKISVTDYDYEDKVKQYSCPTDWSVKSGDETKCEKVETQDCQTGKIDNSACVNEATPTPVSTPETCVGDQHLDATGLKCVSFSGSGPAPRNDQGNGQVLGASTGQVLGASTMAGTGSFDETIYSAIMSIGATLSAFGIKGVKQSLAKSEFGKKAKKTSSK
jgi:hypothetical protein